MKTAKELLDLIYRKGVAVGFIIMLEKESLGGGPRVQRLYR